MYVKPPNKIENGWGDGHGTTANDAGGANAKTKHNAMSERTVGPDQFVLPINLMYSILHVA